MRFAWWVGLLSAAVSWADAPLETARADLKALRYSAAERSLMAASTTPKLTRAEVVEFYELSALVAAGSNRTAEAKEAFKALLSLDLGYQLKGKPAPRVTTPFYEARALVKEQGALGVKLSASPTSERIGTVTVAVTGSAALVRAVEVNVEEPSGRRSVTLPASGGVVELGGRAGTVTARALGAQGWELAVSEPSRFEALPAAPVPVSVSAPPPPPSLEKATEPSPRFRPLAWSLGIAGAVALGAGAVFGVQAKSTRDTLSRMDVSRAQALQLAPQTVQFATMANVLFIAGGALVAGGVLTFVLGMPAAPVAIVPVQGGAVVSGGASW